MHCAGVCLLPFPFLHFTFLFSSMLLLLPFWLCLQPTYLSVDLFFLDTVRTYPFWHPRFDPFFFPDIPAMRLYDKGNVGSVFVFVRTSERASEACVFVCLYLGRGFGMYTHIFGCLVCVWIHLVLFSLGTVSGRQQGDIRIMFLIHGSIDSFVLDHPPLCLCPGV